MSIKQNGGVFGRNPTFNDVTIDGDLEVTGTSHFEGNVGVGTDSPDNPLMIQSTTDAMLRLTRTGVRSWREYIGSTGNLIIRDLSGGTPADRLSIDTTGNVNVLTGNLAFASGKGIDFSATAGTGTSELLDDYEEGVWTPTYAPQTGSFTSITYNSQLGKYTKVGDTVYAFFDLNVVVDPTGASGTVSIGGLPFFGLQTACFGGIGAARRFATSFTFGGLQTSGTAILPYKTDTSNLNLVPLDVTDLATGGFRNLITAGVTYKVS